MAQIINCAHCHQIVPKAFLEDGQLYCAQCLAQDRRGDDFQAIEIAESVLTDDNVELVCESLMVIKCA
jgi:hypothetical protein